MKRILGLGLVCLMLTNTALASKARLLALGMDEVDNEGSYYIDDVRNIFLNVANVNNYADTLIFEWGSDGYVIGDGTTLTNQTSQTIDNEDNPKAGGGFLKRSGDYVWGLYLGNESNTSSLIRIVSSAPVSLVNNKSLETSDNQIDFFVGREVSGIKWGVNAVYTKGEDKNEEAKDHGYALRLGAMTDQWSAFINSSIAGKAERTFDSNTAGVTGGEADHKHEFDGSLGLHLGGTYKISDAGTVYGYYKAFSWDQIDSVGPVTGAGPLAGILDGRGQEGTVEGSFNTIAIGYGHVAPMANGKLFSTIYFRKKSIEVKFNDKAEATNTEIPLTIGYEAEATSWLTLRGSITQNIYGSMKNKNYGVLNAAAESLAENEFGDDTDGKKVSMRDSTVVGAGASLTFGKLVIDGLISTRDAGELKFDDFMSRVGATYSF